jgi:hypothetical protein
MLDMVGRQAQDEIFSRLNGEDSHSAQGYQHKDGKEEHQFALHFVAKNAHHEFMSFIFIARNEPIAPFVAF